MASTRTALQAAKAEAHPGPIADWLLDRRMPWPEDYFDPELPHVHSPVADLDCLERGTQSRTVKRRRGE